MQSIVRETRPRSQHTHADTADDSPSASTELAHVSLHIYIQHGNMARLLLLLLLRQRAHHHRPAIVRSPSLRRGIAPFTTAYSTAYPGTCHTTTCLHTSAQPRRWLPLHPCLTATSHAARLSALEALSVHRAADCPTVSARQGTLPQVHPFFRAHRRTALLALAVHVLLGECGVRYHAKACSRPTRRRERESYAQRTMAGR